MKWEKDYGINNFDFDPLNKIRLKRWKTPETLTCDRPNQEKSVPNNFFPMHTVIAYRTCLRVVSHGVTPNMKNEASGIRVAVLPAHCTVASMRASDLVPKSSVIHTLAGAPYTV